MDLWDSDEVLVTEENVQTVVSYIDNDAVVANPRGFGGLSTYNRQLRRYKAIEPHLDLLQDLSWAIPSTLDSSFHLEWQQADAAKWDKLSDSIMSSMQDYQSTKTGFWHRIWYGMGDAMDSVDFWIMLIPSDYGLAIVKTSVALLFKLAEKSKKDKQKIIDTFTGLREVLRRSSPGKTGFSDDPEVRKLADHLYKAIVDAIRDMLRVTTKRRRSIEMPRKICTLLGREYVPRPPPPPDVETILQRVTDCAVEFQQAVGLARDETIQRVDRNVHAVGYGVALIHEDSKTAKKNTDAIMSDLTDVGDKVDRGQVALASMKLMVTSTSHMLTSQSRTLDEVNHGVKHLAQQHQQALNTIAENTRRQQQVESKNSLLTILLDQIKLGERENATLGLALAAKDREIAELRARVGPAIRTALISPDDFLAIMAAGRDKAHFSEQANQDLSRVLLWHSRLRPRAQSQVNSILPHADFRAWLASPSSALVVVNANIAAGGELERISAASVFAATLVAGLVSTRPDDDAVIIAHYFCGLHATPSDPGFGPNGFLRSVAMQLVLKLVMLGRLDLSFISDEQVLADLQSPDPKVACVSLCQAVYELVCQFPAGTKVYCILDSIQWFERERLFPLLEIVMECLRQLVDDRALTPVFKVFLTNCGGRPSLKLQKLPVFHRRPDRMITLSSSNSAPIDLSPRAMERQIQRSSTPTPEKPRRDMSRSTSAGVTRFDEMYAQGYESG